jgi:hypothetical protein
MKHNYHSVSAIFAQSECLVVPLFQRPYVWTEDDQWKPLWGDIERVANDTLRFSASLNGDVPKVRPHFMGSVVLDQLSSATGHLGRREIVDGQQRLTTLQVFLKAAHDAAKQCGAIIYAGQFEDLIWNRHVPPSDPNGRFKVWPTDADQDAYTAVMQAEAGQFPEAHSRHSYVQAYRYFRSRLQAWLGEDNQVAALKAEALAKTLKEHIRLIALDIDPGEDAQMIFETLNARGTPLLPLDLVKNWLLREARLKGADAKQLYEEHWRGRFDRQIEYWRDEVGRGHAQRARADLFLQNFLALKLRDEAAQGHLFTRYLQYVDLSGAVAIDSRVATLAESADLYRRIDEPDLSTEIGRRIERLQELDVTTVQPFLMAALPVLDEAAMLDVLQSIESWLVRRLVCRLSTRGYSRFFIELASVVLDTTDTASIPGQVAAALAKSDADVGKWPGDEEFARQWKSLLAYSQLNRGATRFILGAIETWLRTRDDFGEAFAMPPKLEIEHVMPQQWDQHWTLPTTVADPAEARQRRNELIHSFGNLTLVTGKLNKRLSNAPWAVPDNDTPAKRMTLKQKSLTKLRDSVVEHPVWDEQRIMARTDELLAIAQKVWPAPPLQGA